MKYHTQRRKIFAQNFFKDCATVLSFVHRLDTTMIDIIVEVGPGSGMITDALQKKDVPIIAIEKDPQLYARLKDRFNENAHITIFLEDFLNFSLPKGRYAVIANIPFNITAAIVQKLIHAANPPQRAYLVMQKEAAYKFAGIPQETQFSILSKPFWKFSLEREFLPTDFVPVPAVFVVLFKMEKRNDPLIAKDQEEIYEKFVKYGFQTRKKTLKSIYRNVLSNLQFKRLASTLGFPLNASARDLSFDQWLGLFSFFKKHVPEYKREEFERKYNVHAPLPSKPGTRKSSASKRAPYSRESK